MLSPVQINIAQTMLDRGKVTIPDLVEAVYGSRTGCSDNPEHCIRVQLHKARRKLNPLGIQIETLPRGRRWRHYALTHKSREPLARVIEQALAR